jgi:hypothetical protein
MFPEIHGQLTGPVTIGHAPAVVSVGSASLNATGSPRIEIGYRLGEGLGAAIVSYRGIFSKGASTIAGFDPLGAGYLSSLLNINVVDIDYESAAFSFAPYWEFAWRAGIRTAGVYYSNQAIGGFVHQQATNNFVGAGPHATLEVGRGLEWLPGLGFLAKLDGAVLIGNVSQSFEESLVFGNGTSIGDTTRFDHTQTVPVLTFDLGVTYSPPGAATWARFGFGYQFEYWWDVGNSGASRGSFSGNSLYFRGEFNF